MSLVHAVSKSGKYNIAGLWVPLQFNWNIHELKQLLEGYYDYNIIEYLEYRWPMDRDPMVSLEMATINHKGATRYPEHVDEYIKIELEKGTVIGPFDGPVPTRYQRKERLT